VAGIRKQNENEVTADEPIAEHMYRLQTSVTLCLPGIAWLTRGGEYLGTGVGNFLEMD